MMLNNDRVKLKENMISATQTLKEVKKYHHAVVFSLPIFLFMLFYSWLRNGETNLFLVNKVLADMAAFLLAVVLIIGAAARCFPKFERFLLERKHIGMMSYYFAIAHVVCTVFFLSDYFPIEVFFSTGKVNFGFGLTAFIFLSYLALISSRFALLKMGAQRWFASHRRGVRVALLLTFGHVYVLKMQTWIHWYLGKSKISKDLPHPSLPVMGLFITWILLAAVSIRVIERFGPVPAKAIHYFWLIAAPIIVIGTLLRGAQLY